MKSHSIRMQQLFVIVALLNLAAAAQTGGSNSGQSQQPPEGWENSGYVIHQSIEIGYRTSNITGSEQMYNSLVDLRSGPRLGELVGVHTHAVERVLEAPHAAAERAAHLGQTLGSEHEQQEDQQE